MFAGTASDNCRLHLERRRSHSISSNPTWSHGGKKKTFSFKFQGPSGPPFELLWFRQAKNGPSIAALPAVSPSQKGQLFWPRYLPAGIWLQVDDFVDSPICSEVLPLIDDDCCSCCHGVSVQRARGLHVFSPVEVEFKWQSSDKHTVKRTGFALTHADYLTSTGSQGQTIRTGVTIDCARLAPVGKVGMQDGDWWLQLYVQRSGKNMPRPAP